MTDPAIETTGLTKRFGDTPVVSGIDLSVPPESVYGFLGPNGAGKTTTMRMLTTLIRPTSGSAHVAGHPIHDRDAVVPHIGYLPEEPPLYDELTAREQLRYIAGLRDMNEMVMNDRIDAFLDRFDLLDAANDRIDTYSKGMKQKTALIQTILHEPDVVFLDEPTSGLDPRAARTVRDLIAELTAEGMTVFLSTHILPVVEQVADTVGVLHDGTLVAEDTPERLTHRAEQERTLEDVFLDVTSDERAVIER
ncbi:ABC transporter ATP-binding protein [Halalkalicoccus sp. NIPERK01]|uniref:ABC transporter ATP-binding protein n=1 Tax=Halalkalicoccus sp. NIPERK01 TaxID=3053469 RepID=UPI00256F3894|nr:ABC transporter ATP-binding protein [Halalkalicoccus sp. NIPERK01]MDL5363274.1 ABC transporter ATP-binding protein [Halalkalicoccus sp. NIPERK01]